MPSQVLLCAVDRVKLDGRVAKHLKICVEISSTFMNTIQKDADGPMAVARVFPWGSITTPRGRAKLIEKAVLRGFGGLIQGHNPINRGP